MSFVFLGFKYVVNMCSMLFWVLVPFCGFLFCLLRFRCLFNGFNGFAEEWQAETEGGEVAWSATERGFP